MSAQDSSLQDGNPPSPMGGDCGYCGGEVRWFTLAEFADHIKDNPERRANTKALIERTTQEFGPALDLRFKECETCGVASAVSSMRLDPETGRVVRRDTDLAD